MNCRNGFLIIIFFIFLHSALAQQNLFNVPSSDLTLKSTPFFQQQVNISHGLVQLNGTFCWGLGKEMEVGLNLLGLNMNTGTSSLDTNGDTGNPPVYPLFMVNFQKAFTLNKLFKFGAGTQTGFSKGLHFATYNYLNLVTALHHTRSKIITGIYQGSKSFLGAGEKNNFLFTDQIGFQAGLEQEVVEKKLTLIAENISGKHNLGETTVGAACFISPAWALSCGYQFANPKSDALNAVVLELTYVPSASRHMKLFRHGHQKAT
jgi:hypothetical protein